MRRIVLTDDLLELVLVHVNHLLRILKWYILEHSRENRLGNCSKRSMVLTRWQPIWCRTFFE